MKSRIVKKIGILILAVLILISSIFAWIKLSPKSDLANMTEAQKARYSEYDQLETEDIENCPYVKFGAFFTKDLDGDGRAERMLGTCNARNGSDTLYINFSVDGDGYFKDGIITIDSTNFRWSTELIKDEVLKYNCVSSNTKYMYFNDVYAGTGKVFMGSIYSQISTPENYSQINSITLTGTHVSDDEAHTETQISKTIDLTVDWYGTASTYGSSDINTVIKTELVEDEDVELNFLFRTDTYGLINQKNNITFTAPALFDYYPLSVISSLGTYSYDQDTHVLTIEHETQQEYNDYIVTVKYPREVYDLIMLELETKNSFLLTANVSNYSLCYNNPNEGFDNPYTTNTGTFNSVVRIQNPGDDNEGDAYEISAEIYDKKKITYPYTKYAMSKTDILDQYDSVNPTNIPYTIKWSVHRIKETEGHETITIQDRDSRGDYFNNIYLGECFNNTGIYFGNTMLIPSDGSVKVYDSKTNTLVVEFKNESWKTYTWGNPYIFDVPVNDIKVEITEDCTKKELVEVYLKREFDIETMQSKLTRYQIERASYFYTSANFEGTGMAQIKAIEDRCELIAKTSRISLSLGSGESIDAGITEPLARRMYLGVCGNEIIDADWGDGIFLVKIPADKIGYFKVTNVTIPSGYNTTVEGYDYYKQGDSYYIKIITNASTPSNGYSIYIDYEIMPDVMASNGNISIVAYGMNSYCNTYYTSAYDTYDIDGDGNAREIVAYTYANLQVLAPTSFVTTERVSNYNDTNEITTVPNIAEVTNAQRDAKISVLFSNNYINNVSDVVVLGRIPFEGNKFVSGISLNSDFSTTMKTGITLPSSLVGKAVIYYSENGEATNDINDETNGWILSDNVTSFDNIKSYLVVIDSNAVLRNQVYELSYEVNIPENVDFNKKSYSCHSIYYDLNTGGGALDLQIHSNKLGIRVIDYYDLSITKIKEGTNLCVPEAKYQIKEINEEVEPNELSRIIISDTTGKIELTGLRVNQLYSFKEISAPDNYELNNDEIQFKVVPDGDGFQIVYVSEATFGNNAQINNVDGKNVLQAVVEETPKVGIVLHKVDSKTGEPISNVVFEIAGKQYTVKDGVININGLSVGTEYSVKETYNKGYFLEPEFTFTVNKAGDGTLSIDSINSDFANANISNDGEHDLINVDVVFNNNKIDLYTLQIEKVDDIDSTKKLEGAKYLLRKDDLQASSYYTTGEEGTVDIPDLYIYEEGRSITGKYTLKEVEAPIGYLINREEITLVTSKNENGKLQIDIENKDRLETFKKVEVDDENHIIKLTLVNASALKLVKKDSETGALLPNVGFVVYELDENGKIVDFAKNVDNEYIGTKNENNHYVVYTDENGVIKLPLRNGTYKIMEVEFLEGYKTEDNSEIFKVSNELSGNTYHEVTPNEMDSSDSLIKFNYIEDLVDLSNDIKDGDNYNGKAIILQRDLDFKNRDCYRNPDDTSYGDINENGEEETIYDELTNLEGKGFPTFGYFGGVFNGNNHEIQNLYIHTNNVNSVSLFSSHNTIKNLGLTGEIIAENAKTVAPISIGGNNLINCYSKLNINAKGLEEENLSVYGLITGGSKVEKCYFDGNINAEAQKVFVYGIAASPCKDVYNTGNITVTSVEDPTIMGLASGKVTNGYFAGTITVNGDVTPVIMPVSSNESTENCYYLDGTTNISTIGIAKTSEEMKTDEFVELLGDSFAKDSENINNGYPIFEYSDGSFEINKVEDLVKLSESVLHGKSYLGELIKLNSDLDFESDSDYYDPDDISYGDINGNGEIEGIKTELTTGNGFYPIGNSYSLFTGIFDGQNHKISNFYTRAYSRPINDTTAYSNTGLFGYAQNFTIKNLTISGIIGDKENNNGFSNSCMGGIVGYAYSGNNYVENVHNECNIYGSISSSCQVGGIIGYATSSTPSSSTLNSVTSVSNPSLIIKNCSNKGKVKGEYEVGGIVGQVYLPCYIEDCYNTGEIETYQYGSGIVGYFSSSDLIIKNCYSTGNVSSLYSYAGGILGYSSGSNIYIGNCYNTGDVTVNYGAYIGGIVGYSSVASLKITDSYNKGTISETNCSSYYDGYGGIIGEGYINDLIIANCYNEGNIEIPNNYGAYTGGMVGRQYGNNTSVYNCYNTGKISGKSCYVGGMIGYSSSTATIKDCYNTSDFITNISDSSTRYIGGILGCGCGNIENCYNLGNMSVDTGTTAYGYCYVSGIGGSSGNGRLANCYNTGNITATGTYSAYVGGLTNIYGYIENSYNTGNVKCDSRYGIAAGICGTSSTVTCKDCYNTGDIEGKYQDNTYQYVVGIAPSIGSLDNCFNTGNLNGYGESNLYVAGLAISGSHIGSSYNTGDIDAEVKGSSTSYAAGLIAGSTGTVENSYNTGNINYKGTEYNGCLFIGGIKAYHTTDQVFKVYNTGDITVTGTTKYLYLGGLFGQSSNNFSDCYTTGNIYNYNTIDEPYTYVGPIYGYNNNSSNIQDRVYYLGNIEIVSSAETGQSYYAISDEQLKSQEIYDALDNGTGKWLRFEDNYPKLDIGSKNAPVVTNIVFDNTKASYDITSELGENEFGDRVGGTITGYYSDKYVEGSTRKIVASLEYGGNLEEDIEIRPDNGYLISSIKINGIKQAFIEDDNGNTTIDKERFQNVDRSYHIVVTFVEAKNRLVVNKVTEENEPIEGAVFDINEVEMRTPIGNEMVEKVDDQTLYTVPKFDEQLNDTVLGEIQKEEKFGFEEIDGKYVSNNENISGVDATAYIPIDLSDKTGEYNLVINAELTKGAGYLFITDNTDIPPTDRTTVTGNIPNKPDYSIIASITGNKAATDYTSRILKGGNIYYLHLKANKGGKLTINSITINTVNRVLMNSSSSVTLDRYGNYREWYNYDMSSYTSGKYVLMVNASSRGSSDCTGYGHFNTSFYWPRYDSSDGFFLRADGNTDNVDYEYYNITAGNHYYLYFGYYPGFTTTETRSLTINSAGLYKINESASDVELGELVNNSPHYGYIVNDLGYYQPENEHIAYSYSNAYIPIDLSGYDGNYLVAVDVEVSAANYSEYNNINITNSPDHVSYSDTATRVFYLNSTGIVNDTYYSKPIEGNNIYYLHFGNIVGYWYDAYNNYCYIKDIRIYKAEDEPMYFEQDGEKLVSNNTHFEKTKAHSYIPLDLSNTTGKYNLTINAEISSQTSDYGYIYVTESPDMPNISYSTNRLVYISGEIAAKDYKITLNAGKTYYIHMIYNKNETVDGGEDKFTINSITLEYNQDHFYHEYNIPTDSNGQIIRGMKYSTFEIKETSAPEGFIIADPVIHTIDDGTNNVVNITDQKKREVHVHYYVKGTGPEYDTTPIQLATDEIKYGLVGEEYATTPRLQIGDYVLTQTDGEYDIPANASGIFELNTINVYYYYEKESVDYSVHYYYDNVENTDVKEVLRAEVGSTITTYPDKVIRGYSLDRTDNLPLTLTKEGSKDIRVYYKRNNYTYTVNYFYDEVLGDTATGSAPYNSVVSTYEDRSNGLVFDKVVPSGEGTKANLTITDSEADNVINVYYKTPYNISTGVITHDELYTDGTTNAGLSGGIISGQNEEVYETVLKGNDATKEISISPNIGYVISGIKIKPSKDSDEGIIVDLSRVVDANGNATISAENGYLTGIDSDKYVEADFRKISSVIVKYLEKDTNNELATQTTISGYDNDTFKAAISPIANYRLALIGFGEDGSDTDISSYARLNLDTDGAVKGNMYSNTLTVVYFYEKIPAGITVKHIEIDEDDKAAGLDLNSGNVKDTQDLSGYVSEQESTSRNTYTGFIAVDGPVSGNEDIIIVGKDSDSYTATYKEDVTVEVRYYYEEQFDITVGVTEHTEGQTQVTGGTIKFTDDSELEKVNKLGSNAKSIDVIPESGYRVKTIKVNDVEVDLNSFTEDSNHKVTIPAGYFTRVQEGKDVKAEFEKIPAKVYIKYIDGDTNEELFSELVDEGFVGDEYNITLREITNYRDNDNHSKLTGTMTEEDIHITYSYKRLFKVTAGVNSHIEWRHTLIELPKDSDQALTSIVVVGGRVELVNPENPAGGFELTNTVTETVDRGATTANNIKITPDTNYRIVSLTKNGDTMTIVDENGFTLDKFENVQEDIEVIVEFERLKGNLVVEYIDMDTGTEIATREEIEGGYEEEYKTYKKTIDNYKYMGVSDNKNGTISAPETVVSYLYRNIRNIPSKIWVKHIVVTAEEIANGLTLDLGTVKDTEELNGFVSLTQNTMRKIFMSGENEDYKYLKSVDGPEGTEDIVVINKDTDNYVATYKDEVDLEVRYYYQEINEPVPQEANVIMVYTDAETNEVIGEVTVRTGVVGDPYDVTDELIEIPGYRLVEVPSNITGTMDEETRIICYYKKIDAKVVIHYTDVDTGEVIEKEVVYEGKVGDSYNATDKVKEIPGYKPVSIPENIKGTIANEEEIIIYYFKKIEEEKPKDAKVIMVYTDVDTNEVIEEEIVATGKVGDPYDVKGKEIPGYKPDKTPDNLKGTMDKEEVRIIYYYKKIVNEVIEEKGGEIPEAQVTVVYKGIKTGDNVTGWFATLIASMGITIITIIKKLRNK